MPETGIDPLLASAHLPLAMEEIRTRELASKENALLTFGMMQAGNAPNIIPDFALLQGSLRAFDERVLEQMKIRLKELASGIASSFRCKAEATFSGECLP